MFSPSSSPNVAAIEWLAVARAVTPSTAATTRAETTSHTLASTRISGAVCRSSSVRARAARSGMRPNLEVGAPPRTDRDDEHPLGHRIGQDDGLQPEHVGEQLRGEHLAGRPGGDDPPV